MDEQTYYAIARWLTGLSETCLESRFGECHSDIAPCPQNEPTATFPLQEPAEYTTEAYLKAMEMQCAAEQSTRRSCAEQLMKGVTDEERNKDS